MLSVAQNSRADITDAKTVNQYLAGRNRICKARRFRGDFYRTSNVREDDAARVHTGLYSKLSVTAQQRYSPCTGMKYFGLISDSISLSSS